MTVYVVEYRPMHTRLLAGLASLVVAFTALVVTSQASASETTVVLHVAGASAAATDAGPGTAEQPFRTVSAAVRKAEAATAAGTSAVVRVQPAVYREAVSISSSTTTAAMTIEGTGPGVVLSGADVWTGWTAQSAGVWKRAWPHTWGLAPLPAGWPASSPLLQRRELVVVDGQLLRQVLSLDELAAHDGAYFVDEASAQLFVKPRAGVDLAGALVEVGVRPVVLTSNNRHQLTLRGLAFQHAATPFQRGGVVVNGAKGLTVEGSTFRQNNWAGLQLFYVSGGTFRGNAMNDNGVLGLAAWRNRDLLFEDNETSRNNTWRGLWGGNSNWEDGSKLTSAHRVTFRRHVAVANNGPGLWFDGDAVDVVVEDSFLAGNTRYGAFAEVSQGPMTFRGNRICDNGHVGFMNAKSNGVTLERNELFGNAREAVGLGGASGVHTITDWETGAQVGIRNERMTLRDNVVAQGAGRLVMNNLQLADWEHLKQTLVSEGNTWHSTHAGPFTLPGRHVGFAGWQADTGQDRTSAFTAPQALSCTRPTAPLSAPTPAPAPQPVAAPAPVPDSEPTSAPTTSPTTGADGGVVLGPATVVESFSGEWTDGLTARTTSRTYDVRAGAGTHTASVQVKRGAAVTLAVVDASGRVLDTRSGTRATWSGDLPLGSYRYVVSGDKATSFALTVQVVGS